MECEHKHQVSLDERIQFPKIPNRRELHHRQVDRRWKYCGKMDHVVVDRSTSPLIWVESYLSLLHGPRPPSSTPAHNMSSDIIPWYFVGWLQTTLDTNRTVVCCRTLGNWPSSSSFVRPHPATLHGFPSGSIVPCSGRPIARIFEPKTNGSVQCTMAISYFGPSFCGWIRKRLSVRICWFPSPVCVVEPARMEYFDGASVFSKQSAAVNPALVERMVPAHKWEGEMLYLKLKMYGYARIVVSLPPMILSSMSSESASSRRAAAEKLFFFIELQWKTR